MAKVQHLEGEKNRSLPHFNPSGNVMTTQGTMRTTTCRRGPHPGGRNGKICQMPVCPIYNDRTQLVCLPSPSHTRPAHLGLAATSRRHVHHISTSLEIARRRHELRRTCLRHQLVRLLPRSQNLRKLLKHQWAPTIFSTVVNELKQIIQQCTARRQILAQPQVYTDLQQQQLQGTAIAAPGLMTPIRYVQTDIMFGLRLQALPLEIVGLQEWLQRQRHPLSRARTKKKRLRRKRPPIFPNRRPIVRSSSLKPDDRTWVLVRHNDLFSILTLQ